MNSHNFSTLLASRLSSVSQVRKPLKKNPLRNLGALLKLNPYAKNARRGELLAAAARAASKDAKVAAKRAAKAAARPANKKVAKAFYNTMVTDSGALLSWGG